MSTTPDNPGPDQSGQEGQQQPPHGAAPQYAGPQYAAPQYPQPPQGQYPSGQPVYGQPHYAQGPPAPYAAQSKNWMGITSLVLSLAGLITGITAIAGIILGHLSLSAVKRGEADNRGVGLAGLITGYVLVGLFVIATIVFVVFFAATFGFLIEECGGDSPAEWCTDEGMSVEIEAMGVLGGLRA